MTLSGFVEAFLLGIGLSMDALAVSIALGTAEGKAFRLRKILTVALLFGFFQAAMPLLGWFSGNLFESFVRSFGRYIASLLLMGIGANMIRERNKTEKPESGLKQLLLLAVATSIDALLVGVGYACLGRSGIGADVSVIGVTTFVISGAGCVAGRVCGNLFGGKCAILGGTVLIGLGLKVLFFG